MTQLLPWFLGAPIALALAMALTLAVEWAVWQVETATVRCQSRFAGWRARATQRNLEEQDHAAFFQWLSAQVGTQQMSGSVDETIVEAQRQTELIQLLLDREVPKAVSQCVRTHRMMAQATGAWHMAQVKFEPECSALRARTVWLLKHTADLVQNYPFKFDDPHVLHNAIVLRKQALPNCCRCPYLEFSVHELPELCPTAQLFQPRGADDVAH